MRLPALGVGLTYFGGIEPVLASHPDLIDVLEIEPQTLWYRTPRAGQPYRIDGATVKRLAALRCPKLLHGIGFPVGGTRPPSHQQVPPLLQMIESLNPPWMSEHLSFNRAAAVAAEFTTGFLLPPRQTLAGVHAAAASIRAMATALPIPLAVETGVNYLQPREDEMADGEFVAAVAEEADCGLLLDLHNLWTNERNGRQPVGDFLRNIPRERVWEVHLAGGCEHEGYWLDAHSGPIPDELVQLSELAIPQLPDLRALIFELSPPYLDIVGVDVVRHQLQLLRRLWKQRGSARRNSGRRARVRYAALATESAATGPTPAEWEDTLGALVIGRWPRESQLAQELSKDPGVPLVRSLAGEFRAAMIVNTLKLSARYIMLMFGAERFDRLLQDYWELVPPEPFASCEAEGFGRYLETLDLEIPYFYDVLRFEQATTATLVDSEARLVSFGCDPLPLLRALADRRLPERVDPGIFEIQVIPDDASTGEESPRASGVLHPRFA